MSRSCLSIQSISGAFLAKCIDHFRPSLWFLVPPPSFLLHLSRQAAFSSSGRRIEPRRFPQYKCDTAHLECPGCHIEKKNLTISSNVLSSISGSMLTIPPETRSENGNPALRRRPANAETSFTSLNHTALVGLCQRGGWGMGTPMQWKQGTDWTDFVKGGVVLPLCLLLIGLPWYQGFPGDSPKQKGKWMKMLLLSWRGIH